MRRLWAAAVAVSLAFPAWAVVNTTTSVVEYTCNGVTKAYAVPFKFLANADVLVYRVLVASPFTATLLTQTTDYTVSGALAESGGTVTLVTPASSCASSSYKLRIKRATSRTQGTKFSAYSAFPSTTVERALDRATMLAQEAADSATVGVVDYSADASGGQVTAVGSTTARRLDVRMADHLNPSDFGAACDGATDDAAALAATQTAAGSTKGIVITCQVRVATAVGTVSAPVRFEGRGSLDLQTGGSVTLTGALSIPRGQQVFFQNGGTLTISEPAVAARIPALAYGATPTGTAPSERVYRVEEFPGADLGAKIQAAYDYGVARLGANYVLEGIQLVVGPNPAGGVWTWSTAVDLAEMGNVTLLGGGASTISVGANLTYLIRVGVTEKANRVIIDGFEWRAGTYNVTQAILVGGGTRCQFRNLNFNAQSGDTGRFTYGIMVDRSLDPTGAGLSYSNFENIHASGLTPVTTAMVYANGLVDSRISQIRIGEATTYGVYLDSTQGDVQGNVVENIAAAAGTGTSTAVVHLHADTNAITTNTIRAINGNSTADYGVQMSGAGNIAYNEIDLLDAAAYSVARYDYGGSVWTRALNITRDSGSFTPVWGGDSSNPAIGNGTLSGRFVRTGRTMRVVIQMVAGSTTTFGTGSWFFQLPTHLGYTVPTPGANGTVFTLDAGTGWYLGVANTAGAIAPKWYITSGGAGGKWSPTVPITWTTSDSIVLDSTYEVQ